MINNFIYVLLALLSFNMFTITSKLTSINRIVINTPKQIFETSIDVFDVGYDEIFFNQDKLIENLKKYYDKNLLKYCKSYILNTYFFEEDQSYCTSNKCKAIEVDIKAKITFNIPYERKMSYSIQGGKNGF